MKQIITAFVLLNACIAGLLWLAPPTTSHMAQWVSLELAQVLGAVQAVYWSMWRRKP